LPGGTKKSHETPLVRTGPKRQLTEGTGTLTRYRKSNLALERLADVGEVPLVRVAMAICATSQRTDILVTLVRDVSSLICDEAWSSIFGDNPGYYAHRTY
jgi:hypothetical protein